VSVNRFSVTVPMMWLLVFFLTPFVIVAVISLADPIADQPPYTPVFTMDGGPAFHGDLQKYDYLLHQSLYIKAFKGSMRIATIATLLCLLVAYPMAYVIARADEKTRPLLLMGVVLPFWTSFLIRIYAWIGLLSDNGIIFKTLSSIGLLQRPLTILNTPAAVMIGMVYTYLPFLVLPLYATLQKLDWTLIEAAELAGEVADGDGDVCLARRALPGMMAGGPGRDRR